MKIVIDTRGVHRDEVDELKTFLSRNYWKFEVEQHETDPDAVPVNKTITKNSLRKFDEWLQYNPDITQDDRELIIEFVGNYVSELE